MASVVGAPGVTTWATVTAAGLTAELHNKDTTAVLVEASPTAGFVSLHYQIDADKGIKSLAVSTEQPRWQDHSQTLPGGTQLLSLGASPQANVNILRSFAEPLTKQLSADISTIAVVDFGRLHLGSPILAALRHVDILLLFSRRNNADLLATHTFIQEALSDVPCGWAIVGKKGQPSDAIAAFSEMAIIEEIPDDEVGADALFVDPNPKKLRRSPLARAAKTFAIDIIEKQKLIAAKK